MNPPDENFPLSWPAGWPRTPRHKIGRAKFGVSVQHEGRSYRTKDRVTNYVGRDRLMEELRRLGATQIVLSTNTEPHATAERKGG